MDTNLHKHQQKEKEELGRVIKEGKLHIQDKSSKEWITRWIVLQEGGIVVVGLGGDGGAIDNNHTADSNEREEPKTTTTTTNGFVMVFSSPNEEADIRMLPDEARRSRESKVFPFTVRNLHRCCDLPNHNHNSETTKTTKTTTDNEEIIFATPNGREMWEWASSIRYHGHTPIETEIPHVLRACTILSHDRYFEDPDMLQNVLLKMFTYPNLPSNSVADDDDDVDDDDSREEDIWHRTFMDITSSLYDTPSEIPTMHLLPTTTTTATKAYNSPYSFYDFAYRVLVGSCVHVNEKCFELITSTSLCNIPSLANRHGNTPLSMLCEGDYHPSRNFMIRALWKMGHPNLERYFACGYQAFSILVAKPSFLAGAGNVLGQPVHPDDRTLCRFLRERGDGKVANRELTEELERACRKQMVEFQSDHERLITAVCIPPGIEVERWGRTVLKRLDLSRNGIFELPEELYNFTSLESLNVSMNCIFELSHRLGNLTNLTDLNLEANLIEDLPCTIESLERIVEFRCAHNPITLPPSNVWSRGIHNVRMFFRDVRESGTELNTDLRVLVLGLSEAGKTSLINGLINPNGRALTRVGDRTVGIEKRKWVLDPREQGTGTVGGGTPKQQPQQQQQPIQMLTYDFAGQEEYYITHHLFLGSKALYIIAFDLSTYELSSLDEQIMLWWDSIQNRVCDATSNDSKTPKVILVGTHADMVDNAQETADGIHKVLEAQFRLRSESLTNRLERIKKELEDLDPRRKKKSKSDEDGYKCEDLSKASSSPTQQRNEEYNMLPTDKKLQIMALKSEQKKLHHEQQCTIVLPRTIKAVSSKDMQNFDKLKEQIASSLTETSPSGKYFPFLNLPVPRAWCQVRRFVRQQSTLKGRECMKLPKYFKILYDELGVKEDVGRRATHFCHDLGDVLFFEKEDLVFLQPSFLIDTFKCVIRHDHRESTYWTDELLDQGITEAQFNLGKELLLQKGELDYWLLKVLWSHVFENNTEPDIANNLIQLLETFDIATSIKQRGRSAIIIPEFQPKMLGKSWSEHADDKSFEVQRWICVDSKLPNGLLKRIQVKIIKKIYKRSGAQKFNLSQNEIHIIDNKAIELYCTRGCIGFGTSEGVRLHIRGRDKNSVLTLLSKVCACINSTLAEFPGLNFEHYIVHMTQNGLSFHKLEEVQAIQATGKSKIRASLQVFQNLNKKEHARDKNKSHHCDFDTKESKEIMININELLPCLPERGNMDGIANTDLNNKFKSK